MSEKALVESQQAVTEAALRTCSVDGAIARDS